MSFGAPYPSNTPNPKGEWEKRENNKSKTGADKALRWVGIVGVGLIVLAGGLGVGSMLFRPASAPAPVATLATSGNGSNAAAATVASAKSQSTTSTKAATTQTQAGTSAPAMAAIPANFEAHPAPNAPKDQPVPLFGPGYDPKDGKPVYICGTEPDSSYTLLQMQMSGKDVAHGFHLAVVPMGLGGAYNIDEDTHVKYMVDGKWDCMVERVDENAELNMGIITAIADESAGGLGIYARGDLKSYEDLKGKRVGFVNKTSSRFFLLYTQAIMPLESQKTVQVQSFDTIDQALAAFNDGKIDAISGWQPYLSQTEAKGGKPVITSEQLRIIVRSVITSRNAIATKPALVQAFHDAWFDTLKSQLEDVDTSAKQIAAWGHNDWSTISKDKAATQFREVLKTAAQATLKQNENIAGNAAPILNILQTSRNFWLSELAANNETKPADIPAIEKLFDFSYVLKTSKQTGLQTTAKPVNNTFSLQAAKPTDTVPAVADANATATQVPAIPAAETATPVVPTTAPAVATATDVSTTVAVLPCRKFTFLPNSAELTAESIRVLNVCVLPTLQQRGTISLLVKGSAAWPGPAGTYSKEQIAGFAKSRAQAIVSYLVSQKIDPARLLVDGAMPPQEHWETLDSAKQAEDRWVEMTLVASGW